MKGIAKTKIKPKCICTPKRGAGFTLIEVMVALLIVSLALPALVSQVQGQMNSTGYIRDKSMATWVAQNQLAIQKIEYRLTKKFLKGQSTSEVNMADRTWYYEIVSEETVEKGMWRQTISVGYEPEQYIVDVVGFLNE